MFSADTIDAANGISCWVILALTPIKNTDNSNTGKLGEIAATRQASTNTQDKIPIRRLRATETPKGEMNSKAKA